MWEPKVQRPVQLPRGQHQDLAPVALGGIGAIAVASGLAVPIGIRDQAWPLPAPAQCVSPQDQTRARK